jgi:hypothetical protein
VFDDIDTQSESQPAAVGERVRTVRRLAVCFRQLLRSCEAGLFVASEAACEMGDVE